VKAFVRAQYGPPDVLEFEDVDSPVVKDDDVLVRVHAASLNQGDLDYLYGKPFLTRMGIGLAHPVIVAWGLTQQVKSRRWARTSLDSSPVMRSSGT
jgi:NADPH:quinone reductase-like Zn-dependent oxidoreductase